MADIEAQTERSKRSAGPAMPLPGQTVLLLQGGGAVARDAAARAAAQRNVLATRVVRPDCGEHDGIHDGHA